MYVVILLKKYYFIYEKIDIKPILLTFKYFFSFSWGFSVFSPTQCCYSYNIVQRCIVLSFCSVSMYGLSYNEGAG